MKQKLQFAAFLMCGVLIGNLMGGFFSVRAQGTYLVANEVPRNTILMMLSACPAGYTEVSAMNGAMPYGTIAANGDVGGTGGSNMITPTGSNATASFTPAGTVAAPTFTGNAGIVPAETFTGNAGTVPAETVSWPAGVPTFAGNALATHTHTVTPTGTNGTASVATTSGSLAGTSSGAFSKIANVSPGSSFTVPAETFTGSLDTTSAVSAGTPSGTIAWPAGVPTNATASFTPAGANGTVSFTPAGTNSAPAFTGQAGTVPAETWTGNSFDNRPAFVKVIFCSKA